MESGDAVAILTSHFLKLTGAASREETASSFFRAVTVARAGGPGPAHTGSARAGGMRPDNSGRAGGGGIHPEHVGPMARGILLCAIESTRLLQSAFPVGLAAALAEAVANGERGSALKSF